MKYESRLSRTGARLDYGSLIKILAEYVSLMPGLPENEKKLKNSRKDPILLFNWQWEIPLLAGLPILESTISWLY